MAVMAVMIRHRTASQAVTTARTASLTVMAVMIHLLIRRHRTASQAATTARTASLHRLTVNHQSPVVPVVATRSSSDNSNDTHSHSSESSYFSSCSTAEESDPENSQVPGSGVDPSLHIPLYSGSRLTVLESCLLLLQLLLRSVLIACHCIDYRV